MRRSRRTTGAVLSEETDANKLHDLKLALDRYQVYSGEQVDRVVESYLSGAGRDQLEPWLNECVATYCLHLDEDGQVDFKGKAKAFTRTYDFLGSILPYTNAAWEKLSILLNLLIPKLPAPWRRIYQRAFSNQLTWTVTGTRNWRRCG